MKPITVISGFIISILTGACAKKQDLPPTIQKMDPARYAGEWHEIARLPNSFEKGLVAAKATYTLNADGTLKVLNEGLKENGDKTSIEGTAKFVDPKDPGKLKVRFNTFPANLFEGDYWILDLNPEHTRALVGAPNRKFLWLLSKDPDDQKEDFKDFIKTAEDLSFNTEPLYFNPKRLTK